MEQDGLELMQKTRKLTLYWIKHHIIKMIQY